MPLWQCRVCEAYAGGWALARDLRALGHDARTTSDVVEIRARHPDVVPLVRRARAPGLAIPMP